MATEELIIQKSDGTHIKIDASDNIEVESPTMIKLQAGATVTLLAPLVNIMGAITTSNTQGEAGTFTLKGNINVIGNITATGTIVDTSGNTPNHSHP